MKRKLGHHPDYFFFGCVLILVIFGLVMLSSASSDRGKIRFNDTYYYLKHQIYYGLSFGVLGFLLASLLHYRELQKWAFPLLILSILVVSLVFTPLGFSHTGAKRWLNIGSISLQPAEFLKFTLIVYLAAWLAPFAAKKGIRQKDFLAGFIPFLIICGLVGALIIAQPSTTTFLIIMAASLIVYFVSGARLSYILGAILLGVVALSLVILLTHDYRLNRILTFLSPETADQSRSFHLNQSLIAIGSGGLTGVGFGKSTTKFKFLPEPMGDSIFAVIAEELGFVGGAALILIFLALILRGFMIAKNSRDQFAKLTVIGFISLIAIQTFVHVAAISGFIPLTGVPLPFISYGGTSLAVFLTMAGVIVNISRYS